VSTKIVAYATPHVVQCKFRVWSDSVAMTRSVLRVRKEKFCVAELGARDFIGLEDAEASSHGVLRRDGGYDVAEHICQMLVRDKGLGSDGLHLMSNLFRVSMPEM
jgi:hypothetical protein